MARTLGPSSVDSQGEQTATSPAGSAGTVPRTAVTDRPPESNPVPTGENNKETEETPAKSVGTPNKEPPKPHHAEVEAGQGEVDDDDDDKEEEEDPSKTTLDTTMETEPGLSINNSTTEAPKSSPPTSTPTNRTAPSRRLSKRIKLRRQGQPTPKIFQDAVSVIIPLTVTADLRIAIQHTRKKRVQSIYKQFPALKKAAKKILQLRDHNSNTANGDMDEDGASSKGDINNNNADEEDNDGNATNENANNNNNNNNKKKSAQHAKKKKKLAHIPHPDQYGSVLDYLEAKYVRGVQLPLRDDDDDADVEGDSYTGSDEGQGSVYSAGSFLDDTDLQRDVAEQVMADTTLTKLELEDEDGEFFVNVGNLEVEDDQYGDNYDPLQDKDASQTTTTKKRKKPQSTTSSATTNAAGEKSDGKKKKVSGSGTSKDDTLSETGGTKQSTTSSGTVLQQSKKGIKPTPKTGTTTEEGEDSEEYKALVAKAKKLKAKSNAYLQVLLDQIDKMGEEELPRRKTKLKVALTCPQNKQPGDDITFTNPHNPGQRLRVKVPKDCFPGGTFKVTVPVKPTVADGSLEDKDHNTFSREFQEGIDDYARAYDSWCSAQSEVDKGFALFKEKQAKFDPIVAKFPTNLMTPVTVEYVKKLMRRARQNKHKRKKTAELRGSAMSTGSGDFMNDDGTTGDGGDDSEKEGEETSDSPEPPASPPRQRVIDIPTMGTVFPTVRWSEDDFFAI